jgi:hypothetical protein
VKALSWIFGLLAVLVLGGAVGLSLYSGLEPWYLYDTGGALTGLSNVLLVILLLVVAFAPAGRGPGTSWLAVIMWPGLALGAAATLLDELTTAAAAGHTHTTNLKVIGPGMAGGLLPLGLGLLVVAVAAFRVSRRRTAPV